jgi:Uroporphyrinogen decarboxylase (URO-D)
MTKRNTLIKFFSGENDSNSIPLLGWCDPWAQPSRENMPQELVKDLSNITWSNERNIYFCRYLGISVWDWLPLPVKSLYSDSHFKDKTEGQDHIKLYHTPYGELKSISRNVPESPPYTVKHAVETAKDLEIYMKLLQEEEFEIDRKMYNLIQDRRKAIGDDGILLCTLPGSPLGILIRSLAGVENTTFLAFDAPALLKEYAQVVQENHLRLVSTAISCDMDGIANVDDTSTSTQSPQMFEEYVVDYTNAIADFMHKNDKLYIHHSCGLIKDLLPLYNQTRINGVHAYSLNPVGDVEVKDKETLRDDIAVVVILNTAIEHIKDKKAVAKKIKELFEDAASCKNISFQLSARPHWDMDYLSFIIKECKKYC